MTSLRESRILITGASGQVGSELAQALGLCGAELYLGVRRLSHRPPIRGKEFLIDFQDLEALKDLLLTIKPYVVINTAAYTAVDKAESDPTTAYQVNEKAVEVIADSVKKLGTACIHLSTDYVYNPNHSDPISEDGAKFPPNVYADSKLRGELALEASGANALIIRTSWVYGSQGQNFVKTMLRLGREKDRLTVVSDQVGSPTYAKSLAEAMFGIFMQGASDPVQYIAEHQGTYNFSDAGYTSWHEFAQEIFRIARSLQYELRVQELEPISSQDYPAPARRPQNSRLNLNKFQKQFHMYPRLWHANLEDFLRLYIR